MTSDPIGLEGGLNSYAYVFDNPLRWIDARGLAAQCGCNTNKPSKDPCFKQCDAGACYDCCQTKHRNCIGRGNSPARCLLKVYQPCRDACAFVGIPGAITDGPPEEEI